MKNAHHLRRLLAMLCLSICLVALCACASAVDRVDPTRKVSLTLNVTDGGEPLPGVTFSLYRVASMNGDTSFTLADAFVGSGLNVDDIHTTQDMEEAAEMLGQFIKDEGIKADLTATSDESGKLTFSMKKPGLFIVFGKAMHANGLSYTFSPIAHMLPQRELDGAGNPGDHWIYDIDEVDIKQESKPHRIDLRVIKHWEREFGKLNHRPENIQIDLYCDDKLADSVKLNRKNGWKATFKDLPMPHEWTVEERRVPNWYDVSYGEIEIDENDQAVIIVKNTLRHNPRYIPQTGLPWWPVPLLLGVGVLLIVSGYLIRRKGSQRHE